MRWSPLLIRAVVLAAALCAGCTSDGGAELDPDTQPDVTVMGTSIDEDQPVPTLGSAISTER